MLRRLLLFQIRYQFYQNCNFTEIGEPFAEQPLAVAVQQGSHLQKEISRAILELQKERYFETLSGGNNYKQKLCIKVQSYSSNLSQCFIMVIAKKLRGSAWSVGRYSSSPPAREIPQILIFKTM